QTPLDKLCLSQFRIGFGFGRISIDPKVRRNFCFGVLLPRLYASEQRPDEWFDDRGGGDLKRSLMAQCIHRGLDMKEHDADQRDRCNQEGKRDIRTRWSQDHVADVLREVYDDD